MILHLLHTPKKPRDHITPPTPNDIRLFLQIERVDLNCTIKSQSVFLTPNQILTKELRQDMRHRKELIRENVFGLGGNRDHLSACLAHMLYCIVLEEQYNLAYFFFKRIECARSNPTVDLPYGMFLTRLYRHIMEHYLILTMEFTMLLIGSCIYLLSNKHENPKVIMEKPVTLSHQQSPIITVDLHLAREMMVLLVLVTHLLPPT
nr:pentatricopeptide repeat-containing protein [Tanacetum cinerariifolium]GEW50174.1 pentatricopeptide repeat-containing protein [Tanacetum cinerariifolium]